MRTLKLIFPLLLMALLACGSGHGTAEVDAYATPIYCPAYATGFEILGDTTGRSASTVVVTRSPWQGADSSAARRIFVSRNGEDAPIGFDGQVVRAGARRIVCMSSSYIAMLDALGLVDCVVGVSGLGFISNPAVHKAGVADVGYDGNTDYERLVALKPDLVLLYGVTGANAIEGRLRELGIPYAYMGEYLEESPLGKAEWLMVLAEITDVRERGYEVFGALPARYDSLRRVAAELPGHPSVMLNTPYRDQWVMPPSGSYMVQLITDAGGEYIYQGRDTNQSMPVDLEEAYSMAMKADYWLNTGACRTRRELADAFPSFARVPAMTEGRVWNCTLRSTPGGGNDFWESGIMHPDKVLTDLIKMFHPGALADEPFTYYMPLP